MRLIKPFDDLKRKTVLHTQEFADYTLEVKPLSLTRDIAFVHKWVNMDYAKTFWQMEGTYDQVYRHYEKFLESDLGSSMMFFVKGNKIPVAQMDFYNPQLDEVGKWYDPKDDDIGIHLLMGPKIDPLSGLTTNVMISGITYLFMLGANRIIGEPDVGNERANELVKRVGFRFIKTIDLSYKKANLYFLNKTDLIKDLL